MRFNIFILCFLYSLKSCFCSSDATEEEVGLHSSVLSSSFSKKESPFFSQEGLEKAFISILSHACLNEEEEENACNFLEDLSSENPLESKEAAYNLSCLYNKKLYKHAPEDLSEKVENSLNALKEGLHELAEADLQKRALEYFKGYKNENFTEKLEGCQLGAKLRIELDHIPPFTTYYIKTHHGGLKASNYGCKPEMIKDVNPKEILVYKILEEIALGPQSHFFGSNGKNLYIATLDISYDLENKKYYPFITHNDLIENVSGEEFSELKEGKKNIEKAYYIWRNNSLYSPESIHREKNFGKKEENIRQAITKLQLISKLFNLTDVLENPSNRGFVIKDEATDIKIIDFIVSEKNSDLTNKFLSRKDLFHEHQIVERYILNETSSKSTFSIAKEYFKDLKNFKQKKLKNRIEDCYKNVREMMINLYPPLENDRHDDEENEGSNPLEDYKNQILKNIKIISSIFKSAVKNN